eukprot:13322186-Ditylum_brightwellii.AAC.1
MEGYGFDSCSNKHVLSGHEVKTIQHYKGSDRTPGGLYCYVEFYGDADEQDSLSIQKGLPNGMDRGTVTWRGDVA